MGIRSYSIFENNIYTRYSNSQSNSAEYMDNGKGKVIIEEGNGLKITAQNLIGEKDYLN